MRLIVMALFATMLGSSLALADAPVSPTEGEKIKVALEAVGWAER
jgi:hypothetical protein